MDLFCCLCDFVVVFQMEVWDLGQLFFEGDGELYVGQVGVGVAMDVGAEGNMVVDLAVDDYLIGVGECCWVVVGGWEVEDDLVFGFHWVVVYFGVFGDDARYCDW